MKYLPLRQLDPINRALVFDTPDCRVVGGCEIYTTKAAGGDKKLYRNISNTLSSRFEADLRLSQSLSPPTAAVATNNNPSPTRTVGIQSKAVYQTLHSPFGPLDQISARKTYAYLIATLNASHPDYDFSSVLRPTDFRRERNLRTVINTFNTTLFNLGISVSKTLPRMWDIIDSEMDLMQCKFYSYTPDDVSDDPYGEEGLIWSNIYFFFNKQKKRVCYLYLRGISALSHSPVESSMWNLNGMMDGSGGIGTYDSGEDECEQWAESKSIWGDDGFDEDMVEGMEV